MTKILQINDLTYRKNNQTILKNVNLSLDKDHFVGLAGANGAGKTTLMRLIVGVAKGYQGGIVVNGQPADVARKSFVSYSDELRGFKDSTSIKDIQLFYRLVYTDFDSERYQELAEFLNLTGTKRLGSLSKGMRERLMIALTLARKAPLYLLDEPFSGIDVMSRKKIVRGMLNWIDQSSTVIISSHHLEEITNILDTLVIIKDQTIFDCRSTDELVEQEHCSVEEYFESIYDTLPEDDVQK